MSLTEHFAGIEASTLTCDKFAVEHIEQGILDEDTLLFDHKWWDYRTMHPSKATMYFYHRYQQILASYVGKYISTSKGEQFAKHAPKDLRERPLATIRAFWRARQTADALGVPYDIYIHNTLKNFYGAYHAFKSTKAKGKRQDIPYPTQMTSDIINQKVMRDWEAECKVRHWVPESDLILHQDVWFRPQMEVSLIANAQLTPFPENAIEEAVRIGAILRPN